MHPTSFRSHAQPDKCNKVNFFVFIFEIRRGEDFDRVMISITTVPVDFIKFEIFSHNGRKMYHILLFLSLLFSLQLRHIKRTKVTTSHSHHNNNILIRNGIAIMTTTMVGGSKAIPQSSPMLVSTVTKTKIKSILRKINRWQTIHSKFEKNIPFVSVMYAQTLDGMIATVIKDNGNNHNSHDDDNDDIAIKKDDDNTNSNCQSIDTKNYNEGNTNKAVSSNLQLSCKESFELTHALRSIHDGILIGGNTLFHDNPRLNNRLWCSANLNGDADDQQQQELLVQPIPIILDTHLKYVMKMVHYKREEATASTEAIRAVMSHDKVIICCSEDAYKSHNEEIQSIYKCNTIHLLKCKLNKQKIEFGDNDGSNNSGKKELELKGGGLKIESVLQNLVLFFGADTLKRVLKY